MRSRFLFLAIFLSLGLFQSIDAQLLYNRVGSLDTTLNGIGYVGISGGTTYPTRVKQLADRSIIVIGQSGNNIQVVKIRPDGTPDTAFGSGGFSTIPCSPCLMKDLVELPDAKLLLAGETNFMQPQQPSDLLLARLNANGSLDTTFGTNGFVQHDLPVGSGQFSDEHIGEIALLPNGSIIAAGMTSVSTDHINKQSNGLIIKFLPDGSLDSSFGSGGFVRTIMGDEPTQNAQSFANIATFSNGRIAVAFSAVVRNPNEPTSFIQKAVLTKYLGDGQGDTSFGTRTFDNNIIYDIAATSDDGTMALLQGNLQKFGTDGQLDTAFGTAGVVSFPQNSRPNFISIQPSGKFYVSGFKIVPEGNWNPGEIFRFWANGQRDLRFGRSGATLVNINHQNIYLGPTFIEANGSIALTGTLVPNNVVYIRLKIQK
ncbi:MAG: hypothetical protein K1X52_10840 [Pyrinomonadaceae bacterium]|nr:hypothetical protein [Pyrinomonadaceae bacterium]